MKTLRMKVGAAVAAVVTVSGCANMPPSTATLYEGDTEIVSIASPTENELALLDLQNEVVLGRDEGPEINACIASATRSKWVLDEPLMPDADVAKSEKFGVIASKARDCKRWKTGKGPSPIQDQTGTIVAGTVAEILSANAMARIKSETKKQQLRSCVILMKQGRTNEMCSALKNELTEAQSTRLRSIVAYWK